MSVEKFMPDDWQDCGILGEHPVEILASVDTKGGCPDTRPSIQIWGVTAIIDIYGPIRVDCTKMVVTSRERLMHFEELALKEYMARHRHEEESA